MAHRHGLIVDFGGVLTTDVFASFDAFCDQAGLPRGAVRARFAGDPVARDLLAELELGRIGEAEFEPRFAAVLEVEPAGLIDRLFAGTAPEPAMLDAVRAARGAGIRTALLSNSWGRERYDRRAFAELFDAVVISGEDGVRKPDPAAYELAASRLRLAPAACVFVDDLRPNLKPARALGMATVHHRDPRETVAELEALLGVPLALSTTTARPAPTTGPSRTRGGSGA